MLPETRCGIARGGQVLLDTHWAGHSLGFGCLWVLRSSTKTEGERMDAGDGGGTIVGKCGGLRCAWVMWVRLGRK